MRAGIPSGAPPVGTPSPPANFALYTSHIMRRRIIMKNFIYLITAVVKGQWIETNDDGSYTIVINKTNKKSL